MPLFSSADCCSNEVEAATAGCETVPTSLFTIGDVLQHVTDFDRTILDGQLVEVTITGFVVRVDANSNGAQEGYVFFRGIARRYDADNAQPGLRVLSQQTTLSSFPAGTSIGFDLTGNVVGFFVDGASGTYRWDLDMRICIRNQIVNVDEGAG